MLLRKNSHSLFLSGQWSCESPEQGRLPIFEVSMSEIKAKSEQVAQRIRRAVPFLPTSGQEAFIRSFSTFAADPAVGMYMLKGYAGTGKTTMLSALTASFRNIVLMAPTGRAAKVLSSYTLKPAFTIHRQLYRPALTSDGRTMLSLADNPFERTLFIVDEASMIPDAAIDDPSSPFPGVNLLSDLVRYVYSRQGNRLMLVGDDAQLPPVHFELSPALDAAHLQYKFGRPVTVAELKEVVRQEQQSEILANATRIRECIAEEEKKEEFSISVKGDVAVVHPNDLPDLLHTLYREFGRENVMVVTRSNKSAVQYNRLIRYQTLWMEDEIGGGDAVMVVKNNYTWLPGDHPAGFLANGDIVELQKVFGFEERFGHRYAMASMRLLDYPDEPLFEAMVMLDTLYAASPALGQSEQKNLFDALQEYYAAEEPDRRKRNALIRKDPYYNALQIKFAYAVTCHKAQGGQWPVVFVDQGYRPEEKLDAGFYRWLYTAITRASSKLFLLNFNPKFLKVE